ncbi:uncharacterized protein LOC129005863 [Macrosteles quadrilineatus]|uniref:uncharacterized protein LOC129005863 n=1 Tax=Macrosteles quadrilineatus TaxID=74068 RepID=UPI0023E09B17|nr:uncharacterized protein LOC129005863 [Macrosteles quadrilineatus]
MGQIIRRIDWEDVKDRITGELQDVMIYLDWTLRTIFMGIPKDVIDWIDYHIWNFRARMSQDSSNEHEDEYCRDKEGIHKLGEIWSSRNRCNKKICVAHDTIKELRCPIIPKDHEGCHIVKGNVKDPYPQCCDELKCHNTVKPRPIVRPHKPIWWIYENYIHSCSSDSEEELYPHPSTISAKVSGLDRIDQD